MFMTGAKAVVVTAVLVLGVAALPATPAAAAGWRVAGTNLSGSEPIANPTKVDESFVLSSAPAGISISCTGLDVENGTIEPPNKDSASSLVLTSCKGNPVCPLSNERIKTAAVLSEATLEGALAISVVFRPESGTRFAEIEFEGAECSLAGCQPVTGTARALGPKGQDEHTLQLLTATATESSKELKIGSSVASLKGSALLELESHKPWSLL